MGREIRMVPPNWEHPITKYVYGRDSKQPMYDKFFADAKKEWIDGLMAWEAEGKSTSNECEYWEWDGNPPDPQYYRPWRDEEATWFQLWETVSEGTPVSPPFATKEELAEYLAENGDEWDQSCGHGGWGTRAAANFVNVGWAPSGIVTRETGWVDGKLACGD